MYSLGHPPAGSCFFSINAFLFLLYCLGYGSLNGNRFYNRMIMLFSFVRDISSQVRVSRNRVIIYVFITQLQEMLKLKVTKKLPWMCIERMLMAPPWGSQHREPPAARIQKTSTKNLDVTEILLFWNRVIFCRRCLKYISK